jgi:hypothetical protein
MDSRKFTKKSLAALEAAHDSAVRRGDRLYWMERRLCHKGANRMIVPL